MTKIVKTPTQNAIQNTVHFTLQGKGGVGKSFQASLATQFFQSLKIAPVHGIDTDPVNKTFCNYLALPVQPIALLEDSKINERNFDLLMERLMTEDGIFIVDNGSSSFVPMSNYLIENDAIAMLKSAGREVYIHTVVTGGQALHDTLAGFKQLAEQTETNNIVVWLNEYFGAIEAEGKTFTDMKAYTQNADKVKAIIRIAKRNSDTFGKDIELMVSKKLTFEEAINGNDFTLMAKQRIKTVQRDIFEQLSAVEF